MNVQNALANRNEGSRGSRYYRKPVKALATCLRVELVTDIEWILSIKKNNKSATAQTHLTNPLHKSHRNR